MQLILYIYLACLSYTIFTRNLKFMIITLAIGALLALIVITIRFCSIKRVKGLVLKTKKQPNHTFKPFVNVNRAAWYVLQELPHIDRVQAKNITWIRKHNGLYSSLDDFFKKNNIINKEHIEELSKMLKI